MKKIIIFMTFVLMIGMFYFIAIPAKGLDPAKDPVMFYVPIIGALLGGFIIGAGYGFKRGYDNGFQDGKTEESKFFGGER